MFPYSSDLRSVTALCVVEDVTKCPLGYTPIMRTNDLEADADLWKDGFFGRRVTRYVCISKTQGRPEHVLESIQILHDKEYPPEGYSLIAHTTDSSQKAFKKKQLCYKISPFKSNAESIVDIIILSKLKNPPDGYDPIGDINGMHFCIRKISALTRLSTPGLSYGILPGPAMYPRLNDSIGNLSMNDNSTSSPRGNGNGITSPYANNNYNSSANSSPIHQNFSRAPSISGPGVVFHSSVSNTGTLTQLCGLDGVPFTLREDLRYCKGLPHQRLSRRGSASSIRVKSQYDLDHQYAYDFRTEQEAILELP